MTIGEHSFDPTIVHAIVSIARPLVRELATAIVEQMNAGAVDREIDQRSAAALREQRLSPRRYLEAAREGCFPSEKRGRRVVSRLRDVEAWRNRRIDDERQSGERGASNSAPPTPEEEERVLLGLRPKGALRVAR